MKKTLNILLLIIVVSVGCGQAEKSEYKANTDSLQKNHNPDNTSSKPLSIGLTERLHSKFLNETRTVNIYLPPGYNAADTTTYPVIYVPDGGVEEDFVHIAGLVQYNSQPWVGRLPRSIVVGVENTVRRRDFTFAVSDLGFLEGMGYKKEDMLHYGGSSHYISFLEKELQPYINKAFRTNEHNTIVGESLAGLLSTEILLKHPHLFNSYIIISPSLWWGGGSLLDHATNLLKRINGEKMKVYIGAPNKDEDLRMFQDAKKLHQLLKTRNNINVHFDYLSVESHSTIMHQAVYNAFKILAINR